MVVYETREIDMSKRKNIKNINREEQRKITAEPLKLFIAIAPFCIGMAYEWTSAIACFFLLGYLWYCYRNTGRLRICNSILLVSMLVLSLSYGFSSIWAVDSGMALFGFVKFLPLPLFVFAIEQLEDIKSIHLLSYVPMSGAIMVIASWLLGIIPIIQTFFRVNNRLAGFFQYPNTFALYLIMGLIVLISDEKWNKKKVLVAAILFVGIVFTGSRTGFVLLVFMTLCYIVLLNDKKVRLGLLGALTMVVAVTGVFVLVTGNTSTAGRYLTTSLSSSTFLGRLLYFKDAFPVIAKHPLGLGYMGYYYSQGSFQTGVYSVVNVHNELLQLLLDVGWIPTALFVWAVIRGVIKGNRQTRMLILFTILHSMMDFNLQFLSIFFILLTAVDSYERTIITVEKKHMPVVVMTAISIGWVSFYFGVGSSLVYFKMYTEAVAVYPGNTDAWMKLLVEAQDVEDMERIADKILKLNPNNALANSAKARVAYSKGDFGNMIVYKQQAIKYSKYSLEEYLDYFDMLYVGYQLYLEYGDLESAEECIKCIRAIPDMIEMVLDESDPLAYKINDKPELELPDEYQEILNIFQK